MDVAQQVTGAEGEKEEDADAEEEHIEYDLFRHDECYIYQIPARISAGGHRADDWNVEKWMAIQRVRVATQGMKCRIILEDKENGTLFAEAPQGPGAVENVLDSSRYFVLRVEDATSKRHAFIGIGFRERPTAYDFQAALDEHVRYVKKLKEAEQVRMDIEAEAQRDGGSDGHHSAHDFSIKSGEKIHVNINISKRSGLKSNQMPHKSSKFPAIRNFPGLFPPVSQSEKGPSAAAEDQNELIVDEDEAPVSERRVESANDLDMVGEGDEFGDFQSAG